MGEHIVEIVSDSGEGAQKAGQTFGTVCAKMGNGVWTVEIIPAEIKPPARSREGASGIRIRFGSGPITNRGDQADLVVAFNEQVLYGRIQQRAFRPGTIILLEKKWADDPSPQICEEYTHALSDFRELDFDVRELPFEAACLEITPNPRLGKNMFVLGLLCHLYTRDEDKALEEIGLIFAHKGREVIDLNRRLFQAGVEFGAEHLELRHEIPSLKSDLPLVVMNGNQAIGLGIMAAGIEVVSMYPITPATSASHYLAGVFSKVGGFVHQAEDEIAAIGFALGVSYAGKTACTITSGPGLALKTEMIGLAVMAEIPLVIIDVQRGGPATGLPTKVEQGDLLAALYASPGDSPKIIIAASTIEECFDFVITARKLAEEFRTPVVLLTDANLATGVAPIPRPELSLEWMAAPIDQSPWGQGVAPYDWDEETGLSPRPIPGQARGEYVLTGLAHTSESKVAYDPGSQPQARRPAGDPQAPRGARRRGGGPPRGGMGIDPGSDRGGGGSRAPRGSEGLLAPPALPVPSGAGAEEDLLGLPAGDDRGAELLRSDRRPPDQPRFRAPRAARAATPGADPGGDRLLVAGAGAATGPGRHLQRDRAQAAWRRRRARSPAGDGAIACSA
ncbi:MAG: 2-oxoacid:acceptor oxidoreductase family protein [Planctomycetota bacterium]